MKETYTGTQFDTVSVRPFVILFYFEHFEQSVWSFLFFGLAGGEREERGWRSGMIRIPYFTLAPSPLQCTVYRKDYRRLQIRFRMNAHYLGSWIRIRIRVKSWVWIRIRVTVKR
jgi:hypothetical protein